MSIIKRVKDMMGLGMAATTAIAQDNNGDIKDGQHRIAVLGRLIPFIKNGNRIIVKLNTEIKLGGCDCGDPECRNAPRTVKFEGTGISKLAVGEKMFVKFGVKLAMLRCLDDVMRQKKEFFEKELLVGEMTLHNALVSELNAAMPELKLQRTEGLKFKKVFKEVKPTKYAQAAMEVAAAKSIDA